MLLQKQLKVRWREGNVGKGEENIRKKKELNPKDKAWICNFYSFSTFYVSVYESKFKENNTAGD